MKAAREMQTVTVSIHQCGYEKEAVYRVLPFRESALMGKAVRLLKWRFSPDYAYLSKWHRVNINNRQETIAGFPVSTGMERFNSPMYTVIQPSQP